MIPKAYEEPLRRFFNFIFPFLGVQHSIEMRHIPGGSIAVARAFYGTVDSLMSYLLSGSAPRSNLFFGVMPRKDHGGTKESVRTWGVILWADIDIKDGGSFQTLIDSPLPDPCIVVASGHGFHAYWLLREVTSKERIEELNHNIADVLGSDSVGDCARIMRIPYTVNEKPGKPAITSTIIHMHDDCEGHRESSFEHLPTEKRAVRGIVRAKKMMPGHTSRSESLFKVAIDYALSGGNDLTVLESKMYATTAGEKLDEMSPRRREEWIKLTFDNAKKSLSRARKR